MKYFQTYTYNEDGFGAQSVYFTVSNKYSELFEIGGIEIDVINLETVKQDLELKDGSFAVDELSFVINEIQCINQNQKDVLNFILDSTNLQNSRYCALFFGDIPNNNNIIFAGKITDKLSGTDKLWKRINYKKRIKSLREYKFSALSFDVSMLDKCKMTGKIVDSYGNNIPNIYDRLMENNYEAIKNIFDWEMLSLDSERPYCLAPIGNLKSLLDVYLEKASSIISELTTSPITFNLIDSDLGFKCNAANFSHYGEVISPIENYIYDIKIGANLVNTDGAIYLSRKMVDSLIGIDATLDNNYKSISNNEFDLCFKKLDNIAELLFGVARATGTYLKGEFKDTGNYELKFVSKLSLNNLNSIYFKTPTNANIDSSSEISTDTTKFYSQGTNWTSERPDILRVDDLGFNNCEYTQSERLKEQNIILNKEKDNNGKSQNLLLTTSPVSVYDLNHPNYPNFYPSPHYPLNTVLRNSIINKNITWDIKFLTDYDVTDYNDPVFDKYGNFKTKKLERLHTGIYLKINDSAASLAGIDLYRPAYSVLANIDGEDIVFETLSSFINYTTGRDKLFFKIEYSMEFPFWNGFSDNEDGSNPSWKKLEYGKKISIIETQREFELNILLDNLTSDGVLATAYKLNHNLNTGDTVVVSGATPVGFNGTFTVTKIDNNVFTYSCVETGQATGPFYYLKKDAWAEADVEIVFTIISIERSLNKIGTKIKLQSAERFAYGSWNNSVITNYPTLVKQNIDLTEEIKTVQSYKIKSGETIAKYDAIKVESIDGIQYVSCTKSFDEDKKTIGIALGDGVGDGTLKIDVQISGKIILEPTSNYFDDIDVGKYLYSRTKSLNGIPFILNSNLTTAFLSNKNINENLVVRLGKIDSPNSFIIDIMEAFYE